MENENIVPGTNEQDTPSFLFDEPIRPTSQRNLWLMAAALLIFAGFFLPWLKFRYPDFDMDMYDEMDMRIPTINGILLLTNITSEMSEITWLLTVFLVLIPLGAAIVAFNSSLRGFLTKSTLFGIASAVFFPLVLFSLYLFLPKYAFGWGSGLELGRLMKLGIGFILMAVGSLFCFIYAMIKIIEGAKNTNLVAALPFNIIGGAVMAGATYLLFDNIKEPGEAMVYVYLGIFTAGLLLAGYLYRRNAKGGANYYSSIIAGFIFSAVHTITLVIIAGITDGIKETSVAMSFVFLLMSQCLFGFIITSFSPGTARNTAAQVGNG